MYILRDGTVVSADTIHNAFREGRTVLIYGRGENHNTVGLMLDGQHRDTRGQCYSMWDEVWTQTPKSVKGALRAAHYDPS